MATAVRTALHTTPPLVARDASRQPRSLPRLSVRRNFSWIALGNLVNAACSWGRVVLLARMGSAEMIGQLVLAFAVCNPIGTLADLGLSGVLVSDAKGRHPFRDYLRLRLLTSVLAVTAVAITAWISGYDAWTFSLIALAGLAVSLESLADIFHARFQQRERMDFAAMSLMLRGPLGLALLTLLTWWTGDLRWGVLGFSLATATTLLAIDIPCAAFVGRISQSVRVGGRPSDGKLETYPTRLTALAWLSLPLGIAGTSIALATSIPRYAVNHYLGHSALGGFAVAGGLLVATGLMVGAMSQAASPRLAQFYAARDSASFLRLLYRLLAAVAGIGVALLVVMALFGGPVLAMLYGREFACFAPLALCLTLAAVLKDLATPLSRALTSMQCFQTNMRIRIASVIILAILLPGLVQALGLMGAAWAMVLAGLCTLLVSACLVARVVGRIFDPSKKKEENGRIENPSYKLHGFR